LGTSTNADARDYFSDMEKHMIPFAPTQEGDRELIDLAFSKKKAELVAPFQAWDIFGP
jgi:DNA topoisomerase-2